MKRSVCSCSQTPMCSSPSGTRNLPLARRNRANRRTCGVGGIPVSYSSILQAGASRNCSGRRNRSFQRQCPNRGRPEARSRRHADERDRDASRAPRSIGSGPSDAFYGEVETRVESLVQLSPASRQRSAFADLAGANTLPPLSRQQQVAMAELFRKASVRRQGLRVIPT